METKHSWHGLPLADCSKEMLNDALAYGKAELDWLNAIDMKSMHPKRAERITRKRADVTAFIDAATTELELRK